MTVDLRLYINVRVHLLAFLPSNTHARHMINTIHTQTLQMLQFSIKLRIYRIFSILRPLQFPNLSQFEDIQDRLCRLAVICKYGNYSNLLCLGKKLPLVYQLTVKVQETRPHSLRPTNHFFLNNGFPAPPPPPTKALAGSKGNMCRLRGERNMRWAGTTISVE